uniref:Ig-like domain-containing protein n=1 Tax=Oncorhynchus kisutch TaxID=8019 RepID=A0A8C7K6Y7_ONCKI
MSYVPQPRSFLTPTMFSSCNYLFLLSLPKSSMTVLPGQPLTISCKVSYSLSSYWTAWIRQPPGKTLEWIGIIWGGGSIISVASFKSRFTISRDSSNVLYLDITSLQAEDTAVYYCARYPQR